MKSKYGHRVSVKRQKSNRIYLPREANACATVVIPALNEAKRIREVVAYALADPATAEVIVVDDSSIDNTAILAQQAGAQVLTSSMLGKGASMRDGAAAAAHDLVVYLDGDLRNLRPGIVTSLCLPLLNESADFVKARFGRGGGRVTELTAKPMLKVFFPELAYLSQPLGGIIAARKCLLQTLSFEDGYGVDAGLLLDAHLAGAHLAEVDIGSLEHDSQPLQDLSLMANEVSRVIFNRAKLAGRLHVEQVIAMYESQRQVAASIDYVLTLRKGRRSLVLLDMDGTITPSRFALELARNTGNETALMQLLDTPHDDAITRSERIAELFRFVHKQQFEQVARTMEIRPGVIEFVKQARRAGFMVGIVSDSYFVAADIIRRRIFADFALAHTLTFEGSVCNGQLQINPAFLPDESDAVTSICKSNVLRCFLTDKTLPPVELIWAVGDNLNDLEMLRLADNAFVIDPKLPKLLEEPGITLITEFNDLVELLVYEASESMES
ncbi:HAD-IB family phosphatase [Methylomonas sp. OY6]|uniref:HAD-IB family phosphatase n=1 Tax=Methylomonas defluvii TaxID=3045149 RepID=A0ABU4UD38_9GAMM|nr:HAD-IB family phosphatase [Methylomonas sp. OY6]MDX8127338.1 HAD-IB family phosphatase [Methylomonas sp. OY6]